MLQKRDTCCHGLLAPFYSLRPAVIPECETKKAHFKLVSAMIDVLATSVQQEAVLRIGLPTVDIVAQRKEGMKASSIEAVRTSLEYQSDLTEVITKK
jgi:hypothetical protein